MTLYADIATALAGVGLPVWDLDKSQGGVPGIRLEPDRMEVLEGETLVARVRVVVVVPAIGQYQETMDTEYVPDVVNALRAAGYGLAASVEMSTPTIDTTQYRARVATVRQPIN